MEAPLVTCRTLGDFYHVDKHTFEKQYKDILSGYREWRATLTMQTSSSFPD